MEVRSLQTPKAELAIVVTELGMVTVLNPLLEKANSPMLVTLFGMEMIVNPLQPEKAIFSMLVTLFGIVKFANPSQPEKADSPMVVTLLGITVFLHPAINVLEAVSTMALHPLRESYLLLPFSTCIETSPLQLLKAPLPMLVTPLGIITVVGSLHPKNA